MKKYIKGNVVILIAMLVSVLGTLLFDHIVKTFGHEMRFSLIFGIGVAVLGISALFYAIGCWTDNFNI